MSWDVVDDGHAAGLARRAAQGRRARASRAPTTRGGRRGTSRWRSCRRMWVAGATGADPFVDRRRRQGRRSRTATCRENDNHGGGRLSGLPEPARHALAAGPRRRQGRDQGFVYGQGDLSSTGRRGRPARVRRGRGLTFVNRDAEPHDLPHDHGLQGALQPHDRDRLPARQRRGRLRLGRARLRPGRLHGGGEPRHAGRRRRTSRPGPTRTSAACTRSCAARSRSRAGASAASDAAPPLPRAPRAPARPAGGGRPAAAARRRRAPGSRPASGRSGRSRNASVSSAGTSVTARPRSTSARIASWSRVIDAIRGSKPAARQVRTMMPSGRRRGPVLAGEVGERHRAAAGERVPGGERDAERLAQQVAPLQPGVLAARLGGVLERHGEVQVAGPHALRQRAATRPPRRSRGRPRAARRRRDEARERGRERAEPQRRALAAGDLRELGVGELRAAPRPRRHARAGRRPRGSAEAAGAAVEQPRAELALERRDLLGDRRLRQRQLARGLRERAPLRDRAECEQPAGSIEQSLSDCQERLFESMADRGRTLGSMFTLAFIEARTAMRRRPDRGARPTTRVLPLSPAVEQRRDQPVDRGRPAQRRAHVPLVAPQPARGDEDLA